MKKQFIIFLILIFIFGLAPINFSNAITQNQINAEVQIVCTDGADKWFSGSGTIIDPKGIILTNRHVIEGAYKNTCLIGFLESINQEPNFGPKDNLNLAEVKYYTTTDDMDAAVLYLDNSTNKIYPYVDIYGSNSDILQFGDKLEVIGYPSIGGSTITYTSGDFSGFGTAVDGTQNYIKATTQIEHGNSGGAAYNSSGQFIGIPTMVIAGELNSLSYILSINSIKKWLSNILGVQYQNQITETRPTIENPTINIQTDITPPSMFSSDKIIFHNNETGKDIMGYNRFEEGSNITVKWPDAIDENKVDGYYIYFGTDRNANPVSNGVYTKEKIYSKILDIPGIYFALISARDTNGNISSPVIAQYNYKTYPDWVTNDPMQYLLVTNRPTYFYVYDYSNGTKGKLLKEIKFDSSKVQNIAVQSNNVLIEWNGAQNKNFISQQAVRLDINTSTTQCTGISSASPWWQCVENKKPNCNGLSTTSLWSQCLENQFTTVSTNSIIKTGMQVNKPYHFEYNYYFTYDKHVNELGGIFNPFILTATKKITYKENNNSANGLKGKILLQVESHGEAWYVNPKDGKRYYMADGNEAYRIMRYLGVGITNTNLDKMKNDKNFAKKHSGKMFLQIENHGEAFYIDFNGTAHYLKDGAAAYEIMRSLGLGITNNDLIKIEKGNL